jgi:hypothetical protein
MLSRKKISGGVKEAHAGYGIGYTIDGIKRESGDPKDWNSPLRITAFLHKVVMSGPPGNVQEDYNKLWTVFDGLFVDETFVSVERMPNYRTRWIKQSPEFQINIYTNPTARRPPFLIEIIPAEKATLSDWKKSLKFINLWFPNLKVTTVDYAIDEHCYDFRAAEKLFRIQLKHLYIPYQRSVNFLGGDIVEYGDRTRMNSVCRIDDVKMYERGPDIKKKGAGWITADVDRVRLEYSAPRRVLVKRGISVIADLIRHPQFYEINKNIYKFMHFDGSKKLPKLGQDFTMSDRNGNVGCFQLEVIGHRNNVWNIAHYMKHTGDFEVLKSALWDAMRRFDFEWIGSEDNITTKYKYFHYLYPLFPPFLLWF